MRRLLPVMVAPLLLLSTTTAPAQVKMDIPAPAAGSKLENVYSVVAPEVRCAAVCDHAGWLAFGHRVTHLDAQVSLFRLDAQGNAAATPIRLKLPRSPGLARYPIYVLGLAFHPKLPLLYVWQDVDLPKKPGYNYIAIDLLGSERTGSEQIDHLLIYSLEKPQPELLAATCRGHAYLFCQMAGSISVDPAGERLYVPNLRVADDSNYRTIPGSLVLAPDGIPLVGDGDPKADRAAHIAAIDKLQEDDKELLPQRRPPWGHETFTEVWGGCGTGFVHTGRDQVLIGGYHATALIAWKPDDKQARLHSFLVNDSYRRFYAVGHPRLPVAYVAPLDGLYLLRFEIADGNITLVPRQANIAAYVTSPAVVMSKANRLAFGSNHGVVAVNLDDQGRFKRECVQTAVASPRVEAIAYSEKFDRLYVPVETGK
jgi:hypothetical protein